MLLTLIFQESFADEGSVKGRFKVQQAATAQGWESGGCSYGFGGWAAKPLALQEAVPVTDTYWPKAEAAVVRSCQIKPNQTSR